MKNRQVILDMDDYLGLVDKAKESSNGNDAIISLEEDYRKIIVDCIRHVCNITRASPEYVIEEFNKRSEKYSFKPHHYQGVTISKKTT